MKDFVIFLMVAMVVAGCNTAIKNDELVGVWVSDEENSEIQLHPDLTFQSTNIPLDVETSFFLSFSKEITTWRGTWSLDKEGLKLAMPDRSYYYLHAVRDFPSGQPRIRVKLSDEVGGDMIFFDKQPGKSE